MFKANLCRIGIWFRRIDWDSPTDSFFKREDRICIIITLGVYRKYEQNLVGLYYRGFIWEDHLQYYRVALAIHGGILTIFTLYYSHLNNHLLYHSDNNIHEYHPRPPTFHCHYSRPPSSAVQYTLATTRACR